MNIDNYLEHEVNSNLKQLLLKLNERISKLELDTSDIQKELDAMSNRDNSVNYPPFIDGEYF